MFQNRDERKRQKQLKHLNDIAEAFLKARGVYPPDYEGFLRVAGQKEVYLFCQRKRTCICSKKQKNQQ